MKPSLHRSGLRVAPILLFLVLALGAAPPFHPHSHRHHNLFTPTASDSIDPSALRSRTLRPSLSSFDGLTADFKTPGYDPGIRMNLFDDVSLDFTVSRLRARPQGGFVLSGELPEGQGQVVLARRGDALAGEILFADGKRFRLSPLPGGSVQVSELDPSKAPTCAAEVEAAPTYPDVPSWNPQDIHQGCPDAQSLSIRHLLVAYTPQARAQFGSLDGILAVIDVAWACVNLAFSNSHISAELDLVRTLEVTDAEAVDFHVDLDRLRKPADGYYDEVLPAAVASGADYTTLVVSYSDAHAGLGELYGRYSVVSVPYADRALPHELGHNFGCRHDRAQEGLTTGGGFNFGYKFPASGKVYMDLMSYYPGIPLLRFSNPAVTFLGQATGLPATHPSAADNASAIRASFIHKPYTGANQLPTVSLTSPSPNAIFVNPLKIPLMASASDSDGTITQVDFYVDNVLVGTDTNAPFTSDWVASFSPGHYSASVHVYDDQGAVKLSCPVPFEIVFPPVAQVGFTPDVTVVPVFTPFPCDQAMVLLSKSPSGADGSSYTNSVGSDWSGRYVVLETAAKNLLPASTPPINGIIVLDRQAATAEYIAPGPFNNIPRISGDGRFVVYCSVHTNLVPNDTNGLNDIFVYDRLTSTTRRVNVGPGGVEADGKSDHPAISGDGRYVAFESAATNLVPNDVNGTNDVFVADLTTGTVRCVSVNAAGQTADEFSYMPEISAGGRYISFCSYAHNLPGITLATPYFRGNYIADLDTGTVTLINPHPGDPISDLVKTLHLSADGRFITFYSFVDDYVAGDTEGSSDVFWMDRVTGEIRRVSQNASGVGAMGSTWPQDISADGQHVLFRSTATNLLPGVGNGVSHFYRWDADSRKLTLLDQSPSGTQGDAASSPTGATVDATLSGDGGLACFISNSTNLVTLTYPYHIEHAYGACDPDPTATETSTPSTPEPTPTPYDVIDSFPTLTPTDSMTPSPTPSVTPTPTVTLSTTPTPTASVTSTATATSTPDFLQVWPNPYHPSEAVGGKLKCGILPEGSEWCIFTLSGERVARLEGRGGRAEWDGKAPSGQRVVPGLYLYTIRRDSKTLSSGTLMISE